jgi:23S rRNA C2498 (ribose-2'-O)-methylase RlmM
MPKRETVGLDTAIFLVITANAKDELLELRDEERKNIIIDLLQALELTIGKIDVDKMDEEMKKVLQLADHVINSMRVKYNEALM